MLAVLHAAFDVAPGTPESRRLVHGTPLAALWQVVHARNAANGAKPQWVWQTPGDREPGADLRAKFEAAAGMRMAGTDGMLETDN